MESLIPQIPIPSIDSITTVVTGDHIAFVRVFPSDHPDNPLLSSEGMGEIIELRHSTPDAHLERAEEARRHDPDAVELSHFEHGHCLWGVRGTMEGMADFQWDGVSLAGVWIPDGEIRAAANSKRLATGSSERRAWMVEQAADACKAYTAWLNGQMLDYEIHIYKAARSFGDVLRARRTYRDSNVLYSDWGRAYYSLESLKLAIESSIMSGLKEVSVQ